MKILSNVISNFPISLLLLQIIGLLNVFTPQKSLEEFQDV